MITRRLIVLGGLAALIPGSLVARTRADYGLPDPPKGCTLQIVFEDMSAVARCKKGKNARFDPDTWDWSKYKRN